jgi:hypothetical protein
MADATGGLGRTRNVVALVGAILAAVVSGLAIWQAVKPGSGPPRRDGAVQIENATRMRLGQYLERRGKRIPSAPPRLHGTYVAYAVTTDGYKGKAVKVDWRLLTDNGAEQARLLETQPSIHVNADHDRATYSTWVQDPLHPTGPFSIELDLYDGSGNQLDQATRAIRR